MATKDELLEVIDWTAKRAMDGGWEQHLLDHGANFKRRFGIRMSEDVPDSMLERLAAELRSLPDDNWRPRHLDGVMGRIRGLRTKILESSVDAGRGSMTIKLDAGDLDIDRVLEEIRELMGKDMRLVEEDEHPGGTRILRRGVDWPEDL
jgi:hypothetical protein